MKKGWKIFLIVLGIFLAILITLYIGPVLLLCPKFQDMTQNQNYRACSQDSDCVIYKYDEGGCINKNSWLARYASSICSSCSIFSGCLYPTTCTCENNQCQAHYDYGSEGEGVILITDKTEYNKGEEVKVTIKNNLDGEIEFWIVGIENYFEYAASPSLEWSKVRRDIDCPCMALCEKMAIILSPGEERSFIWNQTGDDCQQVEAGKYRARADWTDPRKEYMPGENPAVTSNEFIIK